MTISRARAQVDSWTDSSRPALNSGAGTYLKVQGGGTVKHSFWHAKLPPKGAKVITSTLHLFGVGASGDTYTVDLQRVSAKWAESTIDYNNEPGVTGSTVSVSNTESADATEWQFDVSALVQAICDGAANYGFRLATSDTAERRFYSHDALDFHPYLETEWVDVPDAPTELSPAGGSAVTVAKPVLLFNFHDPVADSDLAAVQVQINSTSDMTTPSFDSGTVATSDPELDLSTTAFAGITLSDTLYWRVRVQNQAGYWSDWSDVVHFTRLARGTLTLASPTGGVVSDVSPTIIWSLSGATQTGFRITLWRDSDPGEPIFDTGRRTSTATSFTLPWSVLVVDMIEAFVADEDTVYRLRLRVWDELTKVTTPGDTAHTEVVTTFEFVEDPTPDPPTSVAVSQVTSGQPHVALDIDIPVAPDSFTIIRNGKTIDTGVVPADIYTGSGTIYRYVDRTAPPNRDLTYKVRCKDSGVVGPARIGTPNPYRYAVPQVWLLDWSNPGSNRMVPIWINLDDCTFEMAENSGQYLPIDGERLVQITQGLKGLSGHIVGRVVKNGSLTAEASVADFLWFKAHPTNQLRMTIGSQNLRVVARNMLSRPLAVPDMDSRMVEFDFAAQDGPTQ